MGRIPTKCKVCGNTDINKIIVHFTYLAPDGKIAGDATTLPKFLYELKYPEKRKIRGAGYPKLFSEEGLSPIRIRELRCDECIRRQHKRTEIKPTRYGI